MPRDDWKKPEKASNRGRKDRQSDPYEAPPLSENERQGGRLLYEQGVAKGLLENAQFAQYEGEWMAKWPDNQANRRDLKVIKFSYTPLKNSNAPARKFQVYEGDLYVQAQSFLDRCAELQLDCTDAADKLGLTPQPRLHGRNPAE